MYRTTIYTVLNAIQVRKFQIAFQGSNSKSCRYETCLAANALSSV